MMLLNSPLSRVNRWDTNAQTEAIYNGSMIFEWLARRLVPPYSLHIS